MRWAVKSDLMAINALQGFVKETDFMEASLRKNDMKTGNDRVDQQSDLNS